MAFRFRYRFKFSRGKEQAPGHYLDLCQFLGYPIAEVVPQPQVIRNDNIYSNVESVLMLCKNWLSPISLHGHHSLGSKFLLDFQEVSHQKLKLDEILKNQSQFWSSVSGKLCLRAVVQQNPASRKATCAQPTPESHPHLLKEGEVNPGILLSEYHTRRRNFINGIHRCSREKFTAQKDQLVIVVAAPVRYMAENIPYVFRQSSDFLYLSGCMEPSSVLCFRSSCVDNFETTLFLPIPSTSQEKWEGPRTDPEAALSLFGVDQVLPQHSLIPFLKQELKKDSVIWYNKSPMNDSIGKKVEALIEGHILMDLQLVLHELRLFKSPAEISLMRKSCDIICDAFLTSMMRRCKSEWEIWAHTDYECRLRGAPLAFPPVVAGGPRATIIHYTSNNQLFQNSDLLLMDAGCDLHGYCSDMARTWPVAGQFTPPQAKLYRIVLGIQEQLLTLCAEHMDLNAIFDNMCQYLGSELQHHGLLSPRLSVSDAAKAAYRLCPHHSSHYLGMDVHDTSTISRSQLLKPGMVITVEPGIYIDSKDTSVPEEFRGIGIRIEDDVLVTQDGIEILTKKCPKSVSDIEALCSSHS
ncbi:unnamed protein product [Darwinula stevensoni]|uniref:Aminopeptidase P N-terminal domain-containing protein n=1 Tax=Darwinula stevensoni TaxID=69355 RepID=A0A7R8XBB8_9CRUS|nr:unnamed protein product [Darwinula stevensoni]CAG0886445.1 unnamed protein product [Darwinula stevensoni]